MNSALFKSKYYGVENSRRLAVLVVGYRGKIKTYHNAINVLMNHGFSVIAYEYGHRFLTDGDPGGLLKLADEIHEDVISRLGQYDEVIAVGASVGAGLCIELSRRINKISYGIYAVAGVSPAETIFKAPLFYFVKKKFLKHSIDKVSLVNLWAKVDISKVDAKKDKPFLMLLGKRDLIVNYSKARTNLNKWQRLLPIKIKTINNGHTYGIHWFIKHFEELLIDAEEHFHSA